MQSQLAPTTYALPMQSLPTELYRRSSSDDDGRSMKRPRASRPKVKSGCITCKARRVKCDEKKPSCLRCQKFGRICDGYAPEPSQPRGLSQLQPRIPSVDLYGPNVSIHTTEEESRYFQFFADRTAKELSGYYDPAFWTRLVLQESHSVAAIRHAVVALGALNKSLDKAPGPDLKVNIIQTIDKRHHEQAVLEHLKAIQALNSYISSSSSPQLRNALIACLLFVCFETFQGSYASSVQQTYGGLKILKSYYIGKPGSRPWIPRRSLQEYSRKSVQAANIAKVLQTREGCDNISKERSIAQHVEEYLENENNPQLELDGISAPNDRCIDPEGSPAYDPRIEHVDIPIRQMGGTDFSKEQQRTMDMYSLNQPSRSVPNDPISHSPPPFWPSNDAHKTSSNFSNSTASTTPPSTAPQTPSSIHPTSSQNTASSRKRPLASRSPTPVPLLQNDLTIEEVLIQSFVRLDGQGLFFGMVPGIPPLIWDIHKVWHIPIPESFPDFSSAQRCWDFLMDRALQFFRRTLFNRAYAPSTSDSPALIARQHASHIKRIVDFEKAFRSVLERAIDVDGTVISPPALVLSLYQKATRILLATVREDSEMIYDSFHSDFAYITQTCNLLVTSPGAGELPRNPRFSFDIGIIPPLHLVATKCRDPSIRRQAVSLLFASPRQEGMWDGVLSARIGRWIIACEEDGLQPPPTAPYDDQIAVFRSGGVHSGYPSPPHASEDSTSSEGHEQTERFSNASGTAADESPEATVEALVSGQNNEADYGLVEDWVVPEENRVQLVVVDFHIPDRYIKVKCQKVILRKDGTREERETVIAW